MDTWTPDRSQAEVNSKIELIKTRMPETYKSIQARAKVDVGAFGLVKRALRGEPNCFYAVEAGNVVGSPFNHGYQPGLLVQNDAAAAMVNFGYAHVCIWRGVQVGVQDGAN